MNINLIFTPLIIILIMFIGFDIITGIAKAIIKKNLNSTIGIRGLTTHALILLFNLFLNFIAPILHIEYIINSVISFYILFYALSITENMEKIGIPIPEIITKIIKNKQSNKK